MNDMHRTLNRNLLKYAVQRQMFNSDGTIADVRKSVLVEVTIAGGQHVVELMSGPKFDAMPSLSDTVAHLPAGSVIEVWDGRYLFGTGKSHDGYLRFETPAIVACETCGGADSLLCQCGRLTPAECDKEHWAEDKYGNETRLDCGGNCEY